MSAVTLELKTLEMIQILLQDNLGANRERLNIEKERLLIERRRLEIEEERNPASFLHSLLSVASPPNLPENPEPPPSHADMMVEAHKLCLCTHFKVNHLQGEGPCLMPGCSCAGFSEKAP